MKNAVALEVKKSILFHRLSVPEDAISGTLARYTMRSLLIFNKEYAPYYVMPTRKRHFFISKKEKTI
ncbi:hypothetical protein MKX62_09625 [Sporosarcina sp. FSL K6-5500]